MKKTLLLVLFCISTALATAQMIIADQYGNVYSPERLAIPPNAVPYSVTPPSLTSTPYGNPTPSGYFQIYYTPNSGFDPNVAGTSLAGARIAVIDRLLKDVSAFINSPLNNNATSPKVNLLLEDIGAAPTIPSGVLAEGSSFYFYPNPTAFAPATRALVDNSAWLTIKTGKSAYTSMNFPWFSTVPNNEPLFYHVMLRFNFGSSFNWNTDYTSSPAANEYDLYSVALHELMHALGIHSLISADGKSRLNGLPNQIQPNLLAPSVCDCYNRYDLHLQTPAVAPSTPARNLITIANSSCGNYTPTLNPQCTTKITSSPTPPAPYPTYLAALSPGFPAANNGTIPAPTPDNTWSCAAAINYAGSVTQPVYTSDIFAPGSSLSHFSDQCQVPSGFAYSPPTSKNLYFVMAATAVQGSFGAKRYPRPEERAVLCDLGYSVNATYGSTANGNYYSYGGSACSGLSVAGVNDGALDGFYQYTVNPGESITITDALANDIGATKMECLEQAFGNTSDVISNVTPTSFMFTPANVPGDDEVRVLRYVPANANEKGNITYIFIKVMTEHCTTCPRPTSNSMVNNGGFEAAGGNASYNVLTHTIYRSWQYLNCWTEYAGNRYASGTVTILPAASGSTQYVNLNTAAKLPIPSGSAMLQNVLLKPLEAGGTYTLSFKYRRANTPVVISIYATQELMVPQFNIYTSPSTHVTPANYGKCIPLGSGGTITLAATPSAGSPWVGATQTITIPTTFGPRQYPYITIGIEDGQGSVDLDDVSILPASTTSTPSFPDASSLLAYYNPSTPGVITTNNIIELPASFEVDANLNLKHCPNVRCAPNAQIFMNGGKTLSITDGTTVRKSDCDLRWKGILNNPASPTTGLWHVIIDKSEIRDMNEGVQINLANTISATDSKFADNTVSIDFLGTPTGYTDVIEGNEFYNDLGGGKIGIVIRECNAVQVGNLSTGKGNSFHDLLTGIYIEHKKANKIYPSATYGSYNANTHIFELYNNDFKDIRGGRLTAAYPYVNGSIKSDKEGSAIYALYDQVNSTFFMQTQSAGDIIVDRTTAGNSSKFRDCDKGIYIDGQYNAKIQNTDMDGGWGITAALTDMQSYIIKDNSIANAVSGISLHGINGACNIEHNTISNGFILPPPFGVVGAYTDAKGIELSSYTSAAFGVTPAFKKPAVTIYNNTLTSFTASGAAISLPVSYGSISVKHNTIGLYNYGSGSPFSVKFSTLNGIAATKINGQFISENTISDYGILSTGAAPINGIQLSSCATMALTCNQMSTMQYGFNIEGNCKTFNNWVVDNTFNNHTYGMLFRHNGIAGSLGDIGSSGQYGGNGFGGIYYSGTGTSYTPTGLKLYSFCGTTSAGKDKIFSPPTSPVNCGSTASCGYTNPQCPNNPLSSCAVSSSGGSGSGGATFKPGIIDTAYEHLVAVDSVTYSEYQAGSKWMEQARLFNILSSDTSLIAADPAFPGFYSVTRSCIIGRIERVAQLMLAVDTAADSASFATAWAAAWTANNALSTFTQQGHNERDINRICLKYKLGGKDTLNITDSATIATIALQCPLKGGNAVYKARSLYLNYQPLMYYSNLGLCNYPDPSDTTNGIYDDEETALAATPLASKTAGNGGKGPAKTSQAALEPAAKIVSESSMSFRLYPNPVTGNLNIIFEEDGVLEISDITGRSLRRIVLSKSNNGRVTVSMKEIPAGVCICRYYVAGKLKEVKKITVMHE